MRLADRGGCDDRVARSYRDFLLRKVKGGWQAKPLPPALQTVSGQLQPLSEVLVPLSSMLWQVSWNVLRTSEPRANTATTTTAAIRATSRPYSTADAPSSVRRAEGVRLRNFSIISGPPGRSW